MAIGITCSPAFARIERAETPVRDAEDFVEASRAPGTQPPPAG